jgi:hypothetical protein
MLVPSLTSGETNETSMMSEMPEAEIETTPQPKKTGLINRIIQPEPGSFEEQTYTFLRNPSDLSISVGFMVFNSFFIFPGLFEGETFDFVLPFNTSLSSVTELLGLHIGMELGRSYVDLQISPNWGGTGEIFFLSAETGIWRKNWKDKPNGFFAMGGSFFYGNVLAFNSPKELAIDFSDSEIDVGIQKVFEMGVNGGLGVARTGVGVTGLIGYHIHDIFRFSIGGRLKFGIAIPFLPYLDFETVGPNLDIFFIPGKFGAFVHTRFSSIFELASVNCGLKYKF